MSADWIPFHRRLAKGPKKSIARGIRFVLLELSLESRNTQGVIDLPPDWDTLDALHDMLGGDRREIRKALEIFSIRDSSGVAAIEIIKDALRHRCVITKWAEWAGPRSGAERQADYIKNKRLHDSERHSPVTEVTPTGHNITVQEIRLEHSSAPAALPKPKGSRGSRLPDDWQPVTGEWEKAAEEEGFSGPSLAAEVVRFKDHWKAETGARSTKLDWSAAFRTWLRNARKFAPASTARLRAAPMIQRDIGPKGWAMPEVK